MEISRTGDRRSVADRRELSHISLIPDRRRKDRRLGMERRKNRRFQVKGVVFAVFRSISDEYMGEVLDISKTGFSVHYIGSKKLNDPYEVNIILADGSYELNNVPCKQISNIDVIKIRYLDFVRQERYGMQFGSLTAYQILELDFFIRNYTICKF